MQHIIRYVNGKNHLHRLDGPAILQPGGAESWWTNNICQRIGGPAITYFGAGGVQKQNWYVNGMRYVSNNDYQLAAKMSDEEMMAMVLKYGNVS